MNYKILSVKGVGVFVTDFAGAAKKLAVDVRQHLSIDGETCGGVALEMLGCSKTQYPVFEALSKGRSRPMIACIHVRRDTARAGRWGEARCWRPCRFSALSYGFWRF